ncbi:MAG: Hsp20/alpha crystallin family protein [Clostridiaceae bacterium]|jgi:HSP20 family protein|nr:Hsp20/alpha crystallin family protein [Clostridiaceae bacterium]
MRFNVIEHEPDLYLSNFRNNLEGLLNAMTIGESDSENRLFQPLTEIRENDKEYKVSVQLPGIKKEDIDIELGKNSVTVSAESKFEEVKENENIHSSQFCYGKFNKTLELAKDIDVNKSTCDYTDGVLHLVLKKVNEKKEIKKLKVS